MTDDVNKAAKTIETAADAVMHATGTEQAAAQQKFLEAVHGAGQNGQGFLNEVAAQIKKDTTGIGTSNASFTSDDVGNVTHIDFAPSKLDFKGHGTASADVTADDQKIAGDKRFAAKDAGPYLAQGDKHVPVYDPLRPPGIGELGAAHGVDDVQHKSTKTTHNPNGSTTYDYEGKVAGDLYKDVHQVSYPELTAGDKPANFKGSQTIGADGNPVSMHIEYDPPKTIALKGLSDDRPEAMVDVKSMSSRLTKDGNYDTTVTSASGQIMHLVTDKTGQVVQVIHRDTRPGELT